MDLVYHITTKENWLKQKEQEEFYAPSLDSEGFIHCSKIELVEKVIARYYADQTNLVLLTIDPAKLTSPCVYEISTGGEKYPHIYGKIDRDAIIAIKEK